MRRVKFVVSKHPYAHADDAGNTAVTRALMKAASESCTVGAIALSSRPGDATGHVPVQIVPKPEVRLKTLALRSLRARRSLIHTRFCTPSLVQTVASDDSEVLVAEHTYMAEAVLAANRHLDGTRLLVNCHVLESAVLRRGARAPLGPLLRVESLRTKRDELRCLRAAHAAACFDPAEVQQLKREGVQRVTRLDMVLPPAERPPAGKEPRALFVGARDWLPNRRAYQELLRLWPRIADQVPNARLTIVGREQRGESPIADASVEKVGFVDDLAPVWRSASVLLAPVTVGGGVRVKVLDAARHGVPVVGTPEAIGSIAEYLPVTAAHGDDEFVSRAVELLSDLGRARSEGLRLHEENQRLHDDGFLERQVERWLVG